MREQVGGTIGVLVLLSFLGIGIDVVIHPSRYMNAYLRRGGDMLRDCNKMQLRLAGIIFSGFVAWMLYELIRGSGR